MKKLTTNSKLIGCLMGRVFKIRLKSDAFFP